MLIEAFEDKLILRALSVSESAFLQITISNSFFQSYEIAQNGRALNQQSLKCKVACKPLVASMARSLSQIEQLTFELDTRTDKLMTESLLMNGIRKRHSFCFLDQPTVLTASLERRDALFELAINTHAVSTGLQNLHQSVADISFTPVVQFVRDDTRSKVDANGTSVALGWQCSPVSLRLRSQNEALARKDASFFSSDFNIPAREFLRFNIQSHPLQFTVDFPSDQSRHADMESQYSIRTDSSSLDTFFPWLTSHVLAGTTERKISSEPIRTVSLSSLRDGQRCLHQQLSGFSFGVKELKAILALCEAMQSTLCVYMSAPGDPLLLSTTDGQSNDDRGMFADLIVSTLPDTQPHAPPEIKSLSTTKHSVTIAEPPRTQTQGSIQSSDHNVLLQHSSTADKDSLELSQGEVLTAASLQNDDVFSPSTTQALSRKRKRSDDDAELNELNDDLGLEEFDLEMEMAGTL